MQARPVRPAVRLLRALPLLAPTRPPRARDDRSDHHVKHVPRAVAGPATHLRVAASYTKLSSGSHESARASGRLGENASGRMASYDLCSRNGVNPVASDTEMQRISFSSV
eukprot:tig00000076_g2446.t1